MSAKIAVVFYSLYGHLQTLAEEVKKAAEQVDGVTVDLFQVEETLSEEIRAKMHAPPRANIPVIKAAQLADYDGIAFGFPTRYGRAVAQMSQLFDQCGSLWAAGKLVGKSATVFTGTSSQHGGQETTALTTVPFFAHMGMITVFPGYQAKELSDNSEIIGGSAYGAASISSGDGSRAVTDKEKEIARVQGKYFAEITKKLAAK